MSLSHRVVARRNIVSGKKDCNGQLMIKTRFFYSDKKYKEKIKTAEFKEIVFKAVLDFKDIYDFLNED